MNSDKVIIIGAGISGLGASYTLRQHRIFDIRAGGMD